MTLAKNKRLVNYSELKTFDDELAEYCEKQQIYKGDFIRKAVREKFKDNKRRLSFNVMLVNSFKSKSKSYNGMNSAAAKILNIPYPYPERTIIVCKTLKKDQRNDMIKHEIIEYLLLKHNKLNYTQAHNQAEDLQKTFGNNLNFSWRLIK